MKLIGTIKRILREESNKDLTPVIQTLLDGFVDDHKDVLCKVEVKHPYNRTKLPHSDNIYENYRVTFYLIGGYGSSNWPATQAVMVKFDNLMNEAWDLVYNYTGQKLDMFTKHVKSCDDIINENINRIHQMMGIINENKVVDVVQEMGLYQATRYFGGYDKVTKLMGDYEFSKEDKITFIKDVVTKLCEEEDDIEVGGFGFSWGNHIIYDETDKEKQLIEFYSSEYITVSRESTVMDDDNDTDDYDDFYLGSFKLPYEKLTHSLITEIFYLMLTKI